MPRHSVIRSLFTLCALLGAAASWAQAWPSRALTVVVPYSAGGGVDPVARLVGRKLSERLGQPVVVENKPGASGMIGTATVANAKPDGYTILMSASDVISINQHLYKSMSYNAQTDLEPVTQVVRLPFILVSSPAFPFPTLKDLVDRAKAEPDKHSFASGGTGSLQHLAAEMLMSTAGMRMVHVPYKGVVPSVNDLLGGQVPVLFAGFPTAIQHVRSGKMRALGVTSLKRMEQAKDIPTIAEQGYPGFEVTQWFGVFVPARTPAEIVDRLQKEIAAVLAMPDVRDSLVKQGAEPVGSTPAAFAEFIRAETAKFGRIVKAADVKLD